jgi:ABC-type branched-subunit amino acid transport system ATPase component
LIVRGCEGRDTDYLTCVDMTVFGLSITAQGNAKELLNDPQVKKAYLGV